MSHSMGELSSPLQYSIEFCKIRTQLDITRYRWRQCYRLPTVGGTAVTTVSAMKAVVAARQAHLGAETVQVYGCDALR